MLFIFKHGNKLVINLTMIIKMKKILFIVFIFCLTTGHAQKQKAQPINTLSQKEISQGWQLLFDGKSLTGWKGFNSAKVQTNCISIIYKTTKSELRNKRQKCLRY